MHIDWAVNGLLISQTVHGSMASHLFLTHAKLQSSSLDSATEPGLLYQWQQDLVPFRHGSHRRFADTFIVSQAWARFKVSQKTWRST